MLFVSGLSWIFEVCNFPFPFSCNSVISYLYVFAHPSHLTCCALLPPLPVYIQSSIWRPGLKTTSKETRLTPPIFIMHLLGLLIHMASFRMYWCIAFMMLFKICIFYFYFFLITKAIWEQPRKLKTHLSTKKKTPNHLKSYYPKIVIWCMSFIHSFVHAFIQQGFTRQGLLTFL